MKPLISAASEAAPSPALAPGPARIDELKQSLQQEIKSMVDAKISEQKEEIQKIKETIRVTGEDVKELREGQAQAEVRIKQEIEGTMKSSAANMLNQMSTMFQNLQSSLTERLDKIESKTDAESQEVKRQRQS